MLLRSVYVVEIDALLSRLRNCKILLTPIRLFSRKPLSIWRGRVSKYGKRYPATKMPCVPIFFVGNIFDNSFVEKTRIGLSSDVVSLVVLLSSERQDAGFDFTASEGTGRRNGKRSNKDIPTSKIRIKTFPQYNGGKNSSATENA